jgi:hypothetical protein
MDKSVFAQIDAIIICLVLLIVLPVVVIFGNKLRKRFWTPENGDTKGGVNSLLAALFGLWSFILAFTYGQSGTRFENLRAMIVDESNCLRNAILRTDFFPDSVRKVYRSELHTYLEERIFYYNYAADEANFEKNRAEISRTAAALWATTVGLTKNPGTRVPAEAMVTPLTNLFDVGIRREALLGAGVPGLVSGMLIVLTLAICFVGGFTTPSMNRKEWIVVFAFASLATMILYITLDLARPMHGLIRLDSGQISIVNLRRFF